MGVITERLQRAEVSIVLDTSGSMAWYPNPATRVGSDCGGNRKGTVDLCGDGMCSGSEGSSGNLCAQDCNLSSATSGPAGSPKQCNPNNVKNSRMFMIKRVLRNLLPDLRRSVSFGMVTFYQTGYHRYYLADTGTTKQVSVFFSRMELEALGAWNKNKERPRNYFNWNGTQYSRLNKSGLSVKRDSLYARVDNTGIENRFKFNKAKLLHTTGSLNWSYRGTYYTFDQRPIQANVWFSSPTYRGPQFVDASGNAWVHHRYDHNYSSQGISAGSSGMVSVPMAASEDQAVIDNRLFSIMSKLNTARNGGIWSYGGTPAGPAIQTAESLFRARQQGTGIYAAAGADPQASCRPRFVLLLTDGQSNQGVKPWVAAQNLRLSSTFSGNPIRTLVVGLPGLPSSAVSELDRVADLGDDGISNNSQSAYVASDEAALAKVLKQVLFEIVQGDYTTTEPAVTTQQASLATQEVAVIPSTEYPGWRGQVRALDLTTTPPTELWNAGDMLQNVSYKERILFSGYPTLNNGLPVKIMAPDGTVNINGGCSGCGGVGLRQIWKKVGTPPTNNEIRRMVEWLAGKGRTWKLPPLMHSTPAVVGMPPKYDLKSHGDFRGAYASRERLIYVASNEGLLHAFRNKDGSEAFAYLVPDALPMLYDLWRRGGQDADPSGFRWVLASSPRVEDVPSSAAFGWSTHLVLTMGAAGEQFVALDITDPSECHATSCTLNPAPFTVAAHSRELQTASVLGETWSVPALYYDYVGGSNAPDAKMSMGSGYGSGSEGNFYNHFDSLYAAPGSTEHSSTGAQVDFAVLADTTAAINLEDRRQVMATYQADLHGRIARYTKGDNQAGSVLIDAGATHPIYYSPATFHMGNGNVLLAAASQAQDEASPPSSARTALIIRSEKDGQVDLFNDNVTCDITDICSQKPGCPVTIPSGCVAPGATAKPVTRPLIIQNEVTANNFKYEVFYLLYEEAATACAEGSSWLVRIATDGSSQQLVSATKYQGIRATGVTPVGGGVDIAITQIGVKGKKATAFTVLQNLSTGVLSGIKPYVEVWKEVAY